MLRPSEPESEDGPFAWGSSLFASAAEGCAAGGADPMPGLLTVPSADVEDLEIEFQAESWARTCSVDMFGDAYPAVDSDELERASAAVQAAERTRIKDEEGYTRRAKAAKLRQQPLGGEKLMAALLGRELPASPRVCSSEVCPVM